MQLVFEDCNLELSVPIGVDGILITVREPRSGISVPVHMDRLSALGFAARIQQTLTTPAPAEEPAPPTVQAAAPVEAEASK